MPKRLGAIPQMPGVATPSTNPPSGAFFLYFKSDGNLYRKDGTGGEVQIGGVGGGASLTLQEISTPTGPASGYAQLYFKANGHLYSQTDNGAENVHPPMLAGDTAPLNPKAGDLWLATNVGAPSASPNFSVGPSNPNLTSPGMWVQTGLGPTGEDWTMWIETGV